MLILIKGIILSIGLAGFAYAFYCQTMARKHISREKLRNLTDVSVVATGPMPPKEILDDAGLAYHRGFMLGLGIFASSIVIELLISAIFGVE